MPHQTTVNYESVASRAIEDIAKVTELLGVPDEEAGRPIVELVKEYLAAQARNSVPNEHGKNRYGLDMAYFRRLFNRELNRPLVDFRPDELARVLARAARTADAAVLQEPEFQAARAEGGRGEGASLPPFDPNKPRDEQGLYGKFLVRRVDGSDLPGGEHHGCKYFVLDVDHDKYAAAALGTYASQCEQEYPLLAKDLREKFGAQGGQGAEVIDSTKSCACQFTAEGKLLKECLYHQTRYKPKPAVPEETEAMIDAAVKVFEDAGAKVDLGWLGEACRAYVAASFAPTTPQDDERVHAKCGGRVIGRMRDGDSVSCEKCGKAGYVLIDDGGIDIDWTPAGQEGA
ncbi:hypothetical protein KUV59_03150 [Marinobacter daepoensis]|uniref:hypothetical protein n=1 Tax=Marinobacter daepoensis TaxID=262077 RepID=UPI001C966492|nr:hypothetical protein [Marinobacter daepoensis]MBY6032151.1 hypothetical protein [Marinobacter daepoensis]